MMIIGVDYHPSFQAIAFCVEETGECGEQELNHSDGHAEKFYRDLQQRGIHVRVGMEATGYSRWFERLLAELGFELWIGDPAEIKAKRVKKQKFDREDARLLRRQMSGYATNQDLVLRHRLDTESKRRYLHVMVGFLSTATCGLINKSVILLILFGSASAVAQEQVTFTIVDRVQFTVPGDWPVIASKSTAEKTIFGFQIPNTADEGTPDSSNLSIVSFNLKDAQDKDAFEKKASGRAPHAQEKKLADGWRCSSFLAMQKSTQYVDWDCYRVVADCGVFVRIAWPHLPKNPSDYDKQMETVLSDFLTSVGPSKKQSN